MSHSNPTIQVYLDELTYQRARIMSFPYQATFMSVYQKCVANEWPTQDARDYAAMVCEDLRKAKKQADEERVLAGGLDIRDFSEPKEEGDSVAPPAGNPTFDDIHRGQPVVTRRPPAYLMTPLLPNPVGAPAKVIQSPVSPPRPQDTGDTEPEPDVRDSTPLTTPMTSLPAYQDLMARMRARKAARLNEKPKGKPAQVNSTPSSVPIWIKRPSSAKKLRKLEDKWTGTLTEL